MITFVTDSDGEIMLVRPDRISAGGDARIPTRSTIG
jgi:hypothetical protein